MSTHTYVGVDYRFEDASNMTSFTKITINMTSDKLIKHLSLFCNHSICQVAFILSSHLYYNLLRDLLFLCLFHKLHMMKYSRQTFIL